MTIKEIVKKLKKVHKNLLNYIDNEENIEEYFQNLKNIFDNIKIQENKYELNSLLHLIAKISNNHQRLPNFYDKIEKILKIFKDSIKNNFSNSEIFRIFKGNKRILLFLIEENMFFIDEYIAKKLINGKYFNLKYPQYFSPEMKMFINEKWFPKKDMRFEENNLYFEDDENYDLYAQLKRELPENFYEKRKEGENDSFICEIIRKDSINKFITYVNRNSISFDALIDRSIYETNSFLLKSHLNNYGIALIEYAAFFGSIQIFNYLRFKNARLTSSLWNYAIHGQNSEIIHLLEDKIVGFKSSFYLPCLFESIKCHHNEIANYIKNNYLDNEKDYSFEILKHSLKYFNHSLMDSNLIHLSLFNYLCIYDYPQLVDVILKSSDYDVNKIILNLLLKKNNVPSQQII